MQRQNVDPLVNQLADKSTNFTYKDQVNQASSTEWEEWESSGGLQWFKVQYVIHIQVSFRQLTG